MRVMCYLSALFLAVSSSLAISIAAITNADPEGSTDALSLVQLHAKELDRKSIDANENKPSPVAKQLHTKAKKDRHNPSDDSSRADASLLGDVSDAMRKSNDGFHALGSQMHALEMLMEQVQHQNVASMEKQKAEYDRWLKEQASDIHAMEADNLELTSEIERLKKSNSELRRSAEHAMTVNMDLMHQLEGLSANFSIAAEFTTNVSTSAHEQLHNVTELAILDELVQKDADSAKKHSREHWLDSIGTRRSTLMFQIPQSTQHAKPVLQPEVLVQSLLSSFGELSKEQNSTEVALRDAFEKQSRLGGQQYAALLKAQAELRSTKTEETVVHERLTSALVHLEKVHKVLLAHASHLRTFAKHLGVQTPGTKA